MRILLIYSGHSVATVDVGIGYDRALTAMGHKVDTYMYHDALAFFGKALDTWTEVNENFSYTETDLLRLTGEQAVIAALRFAPDLVLIVCGLVLHRDVYWLLGRGRLGIPIAVILTESPYLDGEQAHLLEHCTIAFTNERNSVDTLREVMPAVHYLPHSFDPERHQGMEVDGEYQTDLFFCGSKYPERIELFDELDLSDIDAKIVMTMWDGKTIQGGIPNDELALWYSGTKVALNPHRTVVGVDFQDDKLVHIKKWDAWSLGPRAFEIAACGAFQISDDSRGELQEVFGDSVVTYSDTADLQDKMRYYLAHEEERIEKARESRRRVQECTFEKRARDILVPRIVEEVL